MTAPSDTLRAAVRRALLQTPGEPRGAALCVQRCANKGEPTAGAVMALAWADWLDRFAGIVANASSADADAAFSGVVGSIRTLASGGESDLDGWRSACRAFAVALFCRYRSADAAAAAYVLRAASAADADDTTRDLYRSDGPRAPEMKGPDARAFQWRIVAQALGRPCEPLPRFIAPHRLTAQAAGESVDIDHLERRVAAEQRAIRRGWREFREKENRS